jgi:hypothetical protein
MHSPFVRQEWEYALSLGKPGFVRPTYWETPLPEAPDLPPPTLRALHFEKIPYFAAEDEEQVAGVTSPPSIGPLPAAPACRARKRALGAGLGALALLLAGVWSVQHPDAITPANDIQARPAPQPPAAVPELMPQQEPWPSLTTVHFESEPAGAKVFLNGELLGVTPLALPLASERARGTVLMTRDGFRSSATEFDASSERDSSVRLVLRRRTSSESSEPDAISRPPRALR